MRKLRWGLRIFTALLIGCGVALLWADVPSTHESSLRSQQFFKQAIWIGVYPKLALEYVSFVQDPVLFVHPTDSGWSGSFSFQIAPQTITMASSVSFVLLLPHGAQYGHGCRCRNVALSTYSPGTLLAVNLNFNPSTVQNEVVVVPVSWPFQAGLQQNLGIGETRYTVLVSNTGLLPHSYEQFAPFYSAVALLPNGLPSPATAFAELEINTGHGSDEITSASPTPDGSYATPYEVGYRLSALSPDVENDPSFRTLSFTIENPRWRLLMQIDASIVFLAVGFWLSEVVNMIQERRQGSRQSSRDAAENPTSGPIPVTDPPG
jgi:hypothetical protein